VKQAPNRALLRVIQAEIYWHLGDVADSEKILLNVQENSRMMPPWLSEEVQNMLEEIQP